MSLPVVPSFITQDKEHIVYNRELFNDFSRDIFEPTILERNGQILGNAPGRGETHFFACEDRQFALRHFRRGGLIAKISQDHYVNLPFSQNRAWAEWYILASLCEKGLPVPLPAAARVVKKGLLYQADLITERISDASSLAATLQGGAISTELWQQIGETIARFHSANLWHADLNAHNILLVDEKVYLIDFDRARYIKNGSLLFRNVERLRRSFEKLKSLSAEFCYTPDDFKQLLVGYQRVAGR